MSLEIIAMDMENMKRVRTFLLTAEIADTNSRGFTRVFMGVGPTTAVSGTGTMTMTVETPLGVETVRSFNCVF